VRSHGLRRRASLAAQSCLLALVVLAAACAGNTAINRSIDDATISTQVKTALLNEPGVPFTRIDVDTAQGVVTLTGVVRSKDEEQKVIAISRKVKGVRDVRSSLRIAPE
jgi:hyperosmotically inducible protein